MNYTTRQSILLFTMRACLLFTLCVSLNLGSGAQTVDPASRPDRGALPVGSYSLSDIENINMTNGNLNLSIPLAALPPLPGGKLSWMVRAIYNSKKLDITSYENGPDAYHPSNYSVKLMDLSDDIGWII